MLSDSSHQYGLELVENLNGSLKRGTVYGTLERMERKHMVTSEREKEGVIPRRLYAITLKGIEVYVAYCALRRGTSILLALRKAGK